MAGNPTNYELPKLISTSPPSPARSRSEPREETSGRPSSAGPELQLLQTRSEAFRKPRLVDNMVQESINYYTQGGFMMVEIGQTLRDYKIIRKLGHGSFSTVWFGQKQTESGTQSRVLKIAKGANHYYNIIRAERDTMLMVRDRDKTHPGYNFVIKIIESFEMRSTNGYHHILVFDHVGYSLFDLMQESAKRGVVESASKNIIKQIFLGLSYLHNKCGLVHTDLKPSNIIIKGSRRFIQEMITSMQKYQELGICPPRTCVTSLEFLNRQGTVAACNFSLPINASTRPTTQCSNALFPNRQPNVLPPMLVSPNVHVLVSDLGNAVITGGAVKKGIIQTPLYRSLEIYLNEEFDYSADIWSVGCISFELLAGETLFPQEIAHGASEHIRLIYQLFRGKIPEIVRILSANEKKFFRRDGTLRKYPDHILLFESPRDILMRYRNWPTEKASNFAMFILMCLHPNTSKRLRAEDALAHPWLNSPPI